ncbi:hypothetical protein AB0K59_37715, partial [Streptomyces scopuliridis]
FGRNWRRKAPIEALMPLRLAKYGVPLADTAPSGLAAAGIEPVLLPPAPPVAELPQGRGEISAAGPSQEQPEQQPQQLPQSQPEPERRPQQQQIPPQLRKQEHDPQQEPQPQQGQDPQQQPQQHPEPQQQPEQPQPQGQPQPQTSPWFAAPQVQEAAYEGAYSAAYAEGPDPAPVMIPAGPGRSRPLGGVPSQRVEGPYAAPEPERPQYAEPVPAPVQDQPEELPVPVLPDDLSREEAYFSAFRKYISENGDFPNSRQFGLYLVDLYGITGRTGGPLTESSLRPYLKDFRSRYQSELDDEYIA